MVEVHGGRILRSITGRKDRHSKVCTSRGPRDRRVRLSANTAIQFYDVQDRLGCDRPSEAIDWLMREAKSAIEALEAAGYQNPEEQELEEQRFPNSKHLSEGPINSLGLLGFGNLPNEVNSTEFHQHLREISSSGIFFTASASSNVEANWSNPHVVLGQEQFFSQGGTLQSSYSPAFCAFMNPPLPNLDSDHISHVSPCLGTGNAVPGDGFVEGFVSLGIQGGEDKNSPVPSKPRLLHYHDY